MSPCRKSGRRVEETGELICSVCTGPIDPDESFEDLFARKEVNELRIACAGESLGCQWIGKVVDYEVSHSTIVCTCVYVCVHVYVCVCLCACVWCLCVCL